MRVATAEQNVAYRAGLCIDCKASRYSAGRPRCNDCHATYNHELAEGPTTK